MANAAHCAATVTTDERRSRNSNRCCVLAVRRSVVDILSGRRNPVEFWMVVTRIRSIASLALCGQTKLTDALREIVAECNAQNDRAVTLTVEQARAIIHGYGYTVLREQLNEIEEFERIAAEDRHRAKQF